MRKIYIIGATVLLFTACKPSVNVTKTPTPGTADFSNYLAIGNSFTAGMADGTLTSFGQLNSFPQRVFEQFQAVPGSLGARGLFIQPLLHSDQGYPNPRKVLGMTYSSCDPADSSWAPVDLPGYVADPVDAQVYPASVNNGQVNNIGVPGIRIADYPVVSYAAFLNVYAGRFYHDPMSTPMKELRFRVDNYHPTFFTFWLGMDDIMGYATAGGQGDGTGNALPVNLNIYNTADITPTAVFEKLYDEALNIAIHTGASGALINIPDITRLPYFNAIPANGLIITRQSEADSLQARYSALKAVFQVGENYYMVQDNSGNPRQAVPGELILLTAPIDQIKCNGWGTTTPIPAKYVLTTDEIQYIRGTTQVFNDFIKAEATLYHLTYVDIDNYIKQLMSGVSFNGINYTTQFVSGGAFSLDGIHMTPRGNALIANQVIDAINAHYHSTLLTIDVNKYQGINFP